MYQATDEFDVKYRRTEHRANEVVMPSTFGQRLAELRQRQQLRQNELAGPLRKWVTEWLEKNNRPLEGSKITQQQISNWENGTKPSHHVISAVASFFGVSPDYMEGYSDDLEREVAEKDITPEEWEILVQIRANEIIKAAVSNLLSVSSGQRLAPPNANKGKQQRRAIGPGKTSQH